MLEGKKKTERDNVIKHHAYPISTIQDLHVLHHLNYSNTIYTRKSPSKSDPKQL